MKDFCPAIIIPTYRRKDGKTPFYLNRCIQSIIAQSRQNYKVYVIGDKYDGDKEIVGLIPPNFYYENRPIAPEREKYTGNILWCCGGMSAVIHGMKTALQDGLRYIIVLDHDEKWESNHLSELNRGAPFVWACTRGSYKRQLPEVWKERKEGSITNILPIPCGVFKSTVCYNFEQLPIWPRNVYEETGRIYPSDADRWQRMAGIIRRDNLKSVFVNTLTCIRDSEGYTKTEHLIE